MGYVPIVAIGSALPQFSHRNLTINHLKKAEEFLEKFAKDKDEKKITDFGKTAAEIIAEIKK